MNDNNSKFLHGPELSQLRPSPQKGFSPLQAHLLEQLGIAPSEWKNFINSDLSLLNSPFLLPDLLPSVLLIKETILQKKHILLFGDRDTDGVSSTSLLGTIVRGFQDKIGGKLTMKTSSANEDYGLCLPAVRYVKEVKPDLLITLDFGTSNYNEINELAGTGIKIIVIDHHEIPVNIPDCLLINPRRTDSKYPEKKICTSVLAMKLAIALEFSLSAEFENFYSNAENRTVQKVNECFIEQLKNNEILSSALRSLLDLASVGTITDMMPLLGENRVIVKNGCKTLSEIASGKLNSRNGLFHLIQNLQLRQNKITAKDLGWSIGPVLNAAGRMGKTELALALLISTDNEVSFSRSKELLQLNNERKERTARNMDRVKRYLERKPERKSEKIIFCYEPDMEPGVSGIVATRLVEEYKRPVVFVTPDHGNARGSVRSFGKENVLGLLSLVSDILLHFGGHPEAGGFSVRIQDIPALQKKILENSESWLSGTSGTDSKDTTQSQICVRSPEVSPSLYKEMEILEPFGIENLQPLISILDAKIIGFTPMGNGSHARFKVLGADEKIKFVIWNKARDLENLLSKKSSLELWGVLEENHF
ncbi:MAG: DHH family phosphoesterase, partial [Leptospira sp.]|nr:DHH family phosphoesterase [Leptospira sp.]